jgi:hypothetical protein
VISNNLFLKIRNALGKLRRSVFFYPYTLGGGIQVKYFSCKNIDSNYPIDKPIVYTKKAIDSYIDKIARKEVFDYGETDTWLYQALEKYSIRGKDVAIISSVIPRYESVCLFYGGRPTTIEYNKRISEDSRIKTLTVAEFNKNPRQFDVAFSISSFEHDGLGRYGDPLNPSGDFEAMRKTKRIIRKGGLLFLAVPVGKDTLVWDAHRIYGRIRLPLLLKGWRVLDAFGFNDGLFEIDPEPPDHVQPVFVLENI